MTICPFSLAPTFSATRVPRWSDRASSRRVRSRDAPLALTDSASAIQPLIVGDNARALGLAASLRDAGCWTTAIRPPTVPVGSARLRLTLTAAHEAGDITRLLEVLHDHGK